MLQFIKVLVDLDLSTGKPAQKGPVPKLPAGRTEVFLDVQGADVVGDENPMYCLLGTLVRRDGREAYFSFVARGCDGEERMYRDFLELVGSCQGGIAYHWNAYEAAHLKRLPARMWPGHHGRVPLHSLRQTAISAYASPCRGRV